MSIFQVGSVLFALFMLYVVNIHKRKSTLSLTEVSFWYGVWILFIFVAMFPDVLSGLAGVLRFSRVFDLLVVIAMMILSSVVFTSYLAQKENTKELEELIRTLAIRSVKENNEKK